MGKIRKNTVHSLMPKPMRSENLNLMRKIDELYTDDPNRGSRSIRRQLGRQDVRANRKRIQRLMRLMGVEAVYPIRSPRLLCINSRISQPRSRNTS